MTMSGAASDSHHIPCVMAAAGFCTEHSAKARGIGYEQEMSPTLRAGVTPASVYKTELYDAYQHHGYREGETCGTLTAEQNQTIRGDTPLVAKTRNKENEKSKKRNEK